MPVSTKIQQMVILSELIKNPITTIQLKAMDIIDPTARVAELRSYGFFILTVDDDYFDKQGEKHVIGRYVLQSQHNNLNNRGETLLERLYSI